MNNIKDTILETLWSNKVKVAFMIFLSATVVTTVLAVVSSYFKRGTALFNTFDKLSTASSYISAISLTSIVFVIGEILRGEECKS
jgi:hypothetical protein